jgi:formate hydrogenlyase subunit 6/NADH:ubiquinone oxidoreductase subunit I
MPLWFFRGLRRGVVTTRYPARPDASAATLPTPPAFRPRLLTRQVADRLVAVCPSAALSRQDDVLVFDVGACTCCGRCAQAAAWAAPDAVTPSGQFELAATSREALVKQIPIRGGER